MKLYQLLSGKTPGSLTSKDLMIILRQCGCDNDFMPYKGNRQFVNFVFYFVHAYSFESTVMDTTCFNESLKLIERNFDFDFEEFKTDHDNAFDENYGALKSFYLKSQHNRQYELLVTGLSLYDQILKDSLKSEVENRKKLFMDAIEMEKQLKVIETELFPGLQLIEKVKENTDEESKVRDMRFEDQLLAKG